MKFSELGLSPEIVERLEKNGFKEAFKVQKLTIPTALKEVDVAVRARTGSGKTLAFVVPLLEKMKAKKMKAIILSPVRELAIQTDQVISQLSNVHTALIYGGVGYDKQINDLKRADIVVGTPGRVLDLIERGEIRGKFDYFVLDEADRMLDMGFIDDVKRIMRSLNPDRVWLFSATLGPQILSIFPRREFEIIEVDREMPEIAHTYLYTRNKISELKRILNGDKTLIFCNTKAMTRRLAQILRVPAIHGDMSQQARERSLSKFRNGQKYLIATDVAARGIDVPDISMIINFDIPKDTKTYVHRVGRTARAGRKGKVVNMISERDAEQFRRIANNLGLDLNPF